MPICRRYHPFQSVYKLERDKKSFDCSFFHLSHFAGFRFALQRHTIQIWQFRVRGPVPHRVVIGVMIRAVHTVLHPNRVHIRSGRARFDVLVRIIVSVRLVPFELKRMPVVDIFVWISCSRDAVPPIDVL